MSSRGLPATNTLSTVNVTLSRKGSDSETAIRRTTATAKSTTGATLFPSPTTFRVMIRLEGRGMRRTEDESEAALPQMTPAAKSTTRNTLPPSPTTSRSGKFNHATITGTKEFSEPTKTPTAATTGHFILLTYKHRSTASVRTTSGTGNQKSYSNTFSYSSSTTPMNSTAPRRSTITSAGGKPSTTAPTTNATQTNAQVNSTTLKYGGISIHSASNFSSEHNLTTAPTTRTASPAEKPSMLYY